MGFWTIGANLPAVPIPRPGSARWTGSCRPNGRRIRRWRGPPAGKPIRPCARGGRPYHPAHETQEWDLARVEAYLAQGVWPRRVDQVGRITLYNRPYGVGRAYAGQQVWVRFEAATHMWVIRGAEGQEWARHPAQEIALETICRLEVSQVKPSRRKRARQNLVADVAA